MCNAVPSLRQTNSSLQPGEGKQGWEREGKEFFGLWFAVEYPWSVLAHSYFRGKKIHFLKK